MRVATGWADYELIDATKENRLERWGDTILVRPDPQVVWHTPEQSPLWAKANAVYHRSASGGGKWEYRRKMPEDVYKRQVKLCAYMNANDIIPKNYAQLTVIESDEEAKDREIFTDEEIGLFFAHKADREAKFILCLIFIGLRPNELAKIKRDDQVHLRDGYFVNGSKTKAGRERKMPIMQIIMPIFKEMWLATQPGDYLFRSPDGRQLDTHLSLIHISP